MTPQSSRAFQPELSFRLFDNNELFAKFGFAANNRLNVKSPFALTIWAADLEDDVKGINGRNRDYLLTGWAKHTFAFNEYHSLGFTFGIIDATDDVDENAFANDEYRQFLNEVFVNAPTGNFVSYDIGGAAQWACGNFSAKGLVMDVGENEEGNNFQFYALELAYRLETSLGEGNYRIPGSMTSNDFFNAAGEGKNKRLVQHRCLLTSSLAKPSAPSCGWDTRKTTPWSSGKSCTRAVSTSAGISGAGLRTISALVLPI